MSDIRSFAPLWGEWEIEKKLGEGSYGAVWKVRRNVVGGRVYYAAVKHISIPKDESEIDQLIGEGIVSDENSARHYYARMLQSISDEIDAMHKLRGYTNIVAYEDHKIIPKEGGIGYDLLLRMELLTPLTEKMKKGLSVQDVVSLGKDIATAITVLSRHQMIHRDIKPQNIFVNDQGIYKLGDYGTARALGNNAVALSCKGTFNYMPPEIYNNKAADIRADIYSLGIVLYRLLNNNRMPFLPLDGDISGADSDQAVVRRLSGETFPAPKHADAELSRIILKASAFRPEDRYGTPEEMVRDLEKYINGPKQTVKADPGTEETKPDSTGHRLNGIRYAYEPDNDETVDLDSSASKSLSRKTAQSQEEDFQFKVKTPKKKVWIAPLVTVLLLGLAVGVLFASGVISPKEPVPTEMPVIVETPMVTENPAEEPVMTPPETPVITATPEITATPTPEVTATPTPEATATPTPEVTATPTLEATATPTLEATATPASEITAKQAQMSFARTRKVLNCYGVTTSRNIILRKEPDNAGEKLAVLGKDEEVYMISAGTGTDGESWTYVEVNGQKGYLKSRYLAARADESGNSEEAWDELNCYGVTTSRNIILRKEPDNAGKKLAVLGRDEEVYMISAGTGSDGESWTYVEVNGQKGYLKSRYLAARADESGNSAEAWEELNCYGVTTSRNIILRKEPDNSGDKLAVLGKDEEVYMISAGTGTDGESWTYVEVNGQKGYLKSRYLAARADESGNSGEAWNELNCYGVTTSRNIILRKEPDNAGEKLAVLGKDEKVYMISAGTGTDGESWTYVEVNGQKGYLKSRYLTAR